MNFYNFDAEYLDRLRRRDPETQAHFYAYFNTVLTAKLRSAGYSGSTLEDIKQDTFFRVLKAVYAGQVREPEKFGSYVCGVCNYVMKEASHRKPVLQPNGDDGEFDLPDPGMGPEDIARREEMRKLVYYVLDQLPKKDRRILVLIFLEEREKDDVCLELGVNREYLRVLVHRALNTARKFLN